jgi:hypothetical protein
LEILYQDRNGEEKLGCGQPLEAVPGQRIWALFWSIERVQSLNLFEMGKMNGCAHPSERRKIICIVKNELNKREGKGGRERDLPTCL